jgi:RNA polymerase sigma-70 factor, ECF subfamily
LPADSESLSSYEASDLIFHLFKKLAPAERLVLTLYYFDECTTEEIASQTGWTRTLVKVRLFRARKKLKALMKAESTKGEENE